METRDFFISYNNEKDAERAAWIVRTLRESGYTVYYQKDDCTGGVVFTDWMDRAIRHSRGLIAVWSRTYDRAPFCKEEYNAALLMRRQKKTYKIIPVRFEDFRTKNVLFGDIVVVNLTSPSEEKNRAELLKAVGYTQQKSAPPPRISDAEKQQARAAYFSYLSRSLGDIQFEGMPTDQRSGAVRVPLEQIFVPLRYAVLVRRQEQYWNERSDTEKTSGIY